MARPFAVFDIDGTLIRWQLYHALNDALAKQDSIDPEAFRPAQEARMNWKRRTGEDSFSDYENVLVGIFDKTLATLTVQEVENAANKVFKEYQDQVYTYTRDLIAELEAKNYFLIALSGSPLFIVQKFAAYYGFDECAGTKYPAKNGRFTGSKELSLGRKAELLQELIDKHQLDSRGSLAIGDTEGDIGMLAMAEQPVAFNPTKKLFQHAREHSWKIVIERKNMVYELDPKDESYVLA